MSVIWSLKHSTDANKLKPNQSLKSISRLHSLNKTKLQAYRHTHIADIKGWAQRKRYTDTAVDAKRKANIWVSNSQK